MNRDCSSNKIGYSNKEEAEEALLEHRGRFNFNSNSGPVNVYICDLCAQYHMTSKGNVNKKIGSNSGQSAINRAKEASFWESKFKKY